MYQVLFVSHTSTVLSSIIVDSRFIQLPTRAVSFKWTKHIFSIFQGFLVKHRFLLVTFWVTRNGGGSSHPMFFHHQGQPWRNSRLASENGRYRRCGKGHTVDGRNPAPVDMVNIPLFTGFFVHPRWCRISSINSMLGFCFFSLKRKW